MLENRCQRGRIDRKSGQARVRKNNRLFLEKRDYQSIFYIEKRDSAELTL